MISLIMLSIAWNQFTQFGMNTLITLTTLRNLNLVINLSIGNY